MSPVLAPVSFDMPGGLHAIRENGDVVGTPFTHQGKAWIARSADQLRDRLIAVRDKDGVAAFLDYAGYIVMLDAGPGRMMPAYPIRPSQVSDQLANYIMSWKEACGVILTRSYRYPAKTTAESPLGYGPVRALALRGTGRFNEIPVTFTWDNSGQPRLTLRPATRLEAAVLSCHVARMAAAWKFRKCHSCGEVFQVAGRKEKFCGYPCAHREAVRSFRRRASRKKSKRNARRRRP
jgi:hypothetical protein